METDDFEKTAVEGLATSHYLASRRALSGFRTGLGLVGRRGLSRAELAALVARLQDDYEALWDRRVRNVVGKVVGPQYRLARESYWRQALDGSGRRSDGLAYLEGRTDFDAVRVLEGLHGGILQSQPRRLKLRTVIEDSILGWYDELGSTPDGFEARRALSPVARQLYGLEPGKTAWPGSLPGLQQVSGAALAVSIAQAGRLAAARDLGTAGIWITSEDELVCARCGVLNRMPLSMAALAVHASAIAERPTWVPEVEFLALFEQAKTAEDPSLLLAESGVGLPPLHGLCRCRIEPGAEPLWSEGNDIALQARRLMGLRMAGATATEMASRPRSTIADSYGAFAAWGEAFAPIFVLGASGLSFSGDSIVVSSDELTASSDSSSRNDVAYALGRAFYERLPESWRAAWSSKLPQISPSSNWSGAEAFAQVVELWVEDRAMLRSEAAETFRVIEALLTQRRLLVPASGSPAAMPDQLPNDPSYLDSRAWRFR
jgi:hypothetical protein